jgi:hypothetical protein
LKYALRRTEAERDELLFKHPLVNETCRVIRIPSIRLRCFAYLAKLMLRSTLQQLLPVALLTIRTQVLLAICFISAWERETPIVFATQI